MFTQEDEQLFAKRGVTTTQVMEQMESFKKGFPYNPFQKLLKKEFCTDGKCRANFDLWGRK